MQLNQQHWMAGLVALSVIFGAVTARAADPPAPANHAFKIGIICQNAAGNVDDQLDALLAAALSTSKDFQLVERQAISKVLAEQKLQALADSAGAIKIGQLLGADLLLFAETLKTGKATALRLRAVETTSGIILLDEIDELASLTQKPETLRQQIEAVVAKAGVPVPQRKLVGIVSVSSEEPGTSLDPLATTLGVLLRVDLARSPNVVVLEREQLQHLVGERGLSGMDVRLRGSTRLIEVKIKRSQEPQTKDKLDAALTVTQMGRGNTQTIRLTLPAGDVPAARRQLADAALKALQVPLPPQAAGDVKAESDAFNARATMLMTHGYVKEALPLAETAYALDPQIVSARTVIRCCHYIFTNTAPSVSSSFVFTGRAPVITVEELKAEKRIVEIHLDTSSRLLASIPADLAEPRKLPWWPGNVAVLPDGQFSGLWWPGAIDFQGDLASLFPLHDPPQTPEQRILRDILALADEEYRLWFDLCDKHKWSASRLKFGCYGPTSTGYLDASPFLVRSGAEFCKRAEAACEQFERDQAAGRWKNDKRCRVFPDLTQSAGTIAGTGRLGNLTTEDIRPLLTWLTQQTDPLLCVQGWEGLARAPGAEGDAAAAKALDVLFTQDVPASVDRGWLGSSLQGAFYRLRDRGTLSTYIKGLLDAVERSGNILPLARWADTTDNMLYQLPPRDRLQAAQRMQTILASKSVPKSDAEGLRHLRDALANQIDRDKKTLGIVHETNPWDSWQCHEIKIANPPTGAPVLIWVQVDPSRKDPELLTLWRSEPIRPGNHQADFNLVLARLPLAGGRITELAHAALPGPVYDSERGRITGFRITSLVTTPQGVFIADFRRGILVVRNGKITTWTQKDGLASDQIWSLAWVNNTLYAGADNGLLSIDPTSGRCKTLASGTAAPSANPLEGGTPYRIANILPSPDGKSLWLGVAGDQTRLGVWRYDLAGGKLDHIVHTSRPEFAQHTEGPCLSWHEGKLLVLTFAGDTFPNGLFDPNSGAPVQLFKGALGGMLPVNMLFDETKDKDLSPVGYASQAAMVLTPVGLVSQDGWLLLSHIGQFGRRFYISDSRLASPALHWQWQCVQEAGQGFVAAIYDMPLIPQTRTDFSLWYFTPADQPKTAPAPVAPQPPTAPAPMR